MSCLRPLNFFATRCLPILSTLLLAASGCGFSAQADHGNTTTKSATESGEKSSDKSAITEPVVGLTERVPWTTSRIKGAAEPPPPLKTERIFKKLKFDKPTEMIAGPDGNRLFVTEQYGKIFSFPDDPAVEQADLFIDMPAELKSIDTSGPVFGFQDIYGIVFDPDFATNRFVYICYTLKPKPGIEGPPDGTRVSRFVVPKSDPPRCDPASELILITWRAGGHNGGCLRFGPDGMLYISSGDSANPTPPDPLKAGQDMSTLLAKIMRIDVRGATKEKPYKIPVDNPFVKTPAARGETWAYGFRNPWRFCFDRVTGKLIVGDVGWELWEMVYIVARGGNYGWSIMEGPQSVHPHGKRGPTPILPATLALPHSVSASVTGGYVYRGKKFPELVGHYIFGDWETRRIWSSKLDGDKLGPFRDIVEPEVRPVCFCETTAGEIYAVDYFSGTIFELNDNEAASQPREPFPTKLSETGLFTDLAQLKPAPGVIDYSIQAEQWADFTTAVRHVALPEKSSIVVHNDQRPGWGPTEQRKLAFPANAVLAKTISLEMTAGDPRSNRRIETQILHFDGKRWRGYTYRWNDAQTDAELVDAQGAETKFSVKDAAAPGGKREQAWTFFGRGECLRCHNPWAQHTLAFSMPQLQKPHRYGDKQADQLATLAKIGVLKSSGAPKDGAPPADPLAQFTKLPKPLVNPYDAKANLEDRGRAYLHINCAHCHQFGAGGSAVFDVRYDLPIDRARLINTPPSQGAFDIPGAQLVASGDPFRSVIYYRLAKTGRGRMPHIGSELVDLPGVQLLADWIAQLPANVEERAKLARLCSLCRKEADEKKQPETDRQRAETIDQMLASTSSALLLADALQRGQVPSPAKEEAITKGSAAELPQIRDLFDRYLPPEKRVVKLGTTFDPQAVLSLAGQAEEGRKLFFSATTQCGRCHKVGSEGGAIGPDLSLIGKKYTPELLLEHIVDPSKLIEPQFAAYSLVTASGQVHSGLLISQSKTEVVLRDAQGKEIRVPADEVDELAKQPRSLMPDQLLRDMSAQQAADVIAFLRGLK